MLLHGTASLETCRHIQIMSLIPCELLEHLRARVVICERISHAQHPGCILRFRCSEILYIRTDICRSHKHRSSCRLHSLHWLNQFAFKSTKSYFYRAVVNLVFQFEYLMNSCIAVIRSQCRTIADILSSFDPLSTIFPLKYPMLGSTGICCKCRIETYERAGLDKFCRNGKSKAIPCFRRKHCWTSLDYFTA